MTPERQLLREIHLALGSLPDVRLFRNQVGVGFCGRVVATPEPGTFVLKNAQRVSMGLAVGSGDLLGWQSLVITPSMVGMRIARFLSVEVKAQSGRPSPEQLNWLQRVQEAGGCAMVARSAEECLAGLVLRAP